MPWFKVDDNYWSHPKVMFQSLDARGLWVTAGTWASNHLTNGRVPAKVLHLIIPRRAPAIDAIGNELETMGLWTRDGPDWVFHDWHEYQPTKEAVEEQRVQIRERQARWRERSHRNRPSNGVSNALLTRDETRDETRTRPDPTRPDPSPLSTSAGPRGPSASTTEEGADPTPCEHGSAPTLCALCRMQRKGQTK